MQPLKIETPDQLKNDIYFKIKTIWTYICSCGQLQVETPQFIIPTPVERHKKKIIEAGYRWMP